MGVRLEENKSEEMQTAFGIITLGIILAWMVKRFHQVLPENLPDRERRILITGILIAVLYNFSVVVMWYTAQGDNFDNIWVDTIYYDLRSWVLAEQLENFEFEPPNYDSPGYYYFVAILYVIFGRHLLLVSLYNTAAIIALALLTYFIAQRIFNPRVAKLTLFFNLFFPNYIPFCFFMLKDAILSLFAVLTIWGAVILTEKKNPGRVIAFSIFALILYLFRAQLAIPLVFICGFHIIYAGKAWQRSKKTYLVLTGVLFGILMIGTYIVPSTRTAFDKINDFTIGPQGTGYGDSQTPGFLEGARGFPEIISRILSNPVAFSKYSTKQILWILVGPVNFYSKSGPSLFYKYGKFVFWENLTAVFKIFLTPMILYGFYHVMRHQRRTAFVVYFFSLSWTFVMLLTHNTFRWGLPMMPFYLMAGAVGCTYFDRIKAFYIPYILFFNIFMIGNAFMREDLFIAKLTLFVTAAGISLALLKNRRKYPW